MKKYFLISCVLLFIAGCATKKHVHLPDLNKPIASQEYYHCGSVFPKGEWQFVHSIDFTMGDGKGTTVVGITTLLPDRMTSALLTVEGFTLFEADFFGENTFQVHRAVPPFDRPGFAEGMMHDIRTIFQPPTSNNIERGYTADGMATCRYTESDGRVTDILPNKDDCWQITSYTPSRIMDRTISGRSCREKGSTRIPEHLVLQNRGIPDYTLTLTLLRADILQ